MFLIRSKKQSHTINKKVIKISATEVASKIEFLLMIIAFPAVMIYTGKGFKATFMFVMDNLHSIVPFIAATVFLAKILFNFGQRTEVS